MPQKNKNQTIVITNFSGRLSRILNGDLNSGFTKFTSSFGYDPFSKPMNLTWLETPSSVVGIAALPQTGKVLSASLAGPNVHVIDQNGNWYQIQSGTLSNPNTNSVIGIASVATQTYNFGTSMEFFGSVVGNDLAGNRLGKLFVGGDTGVVKVNPDGSAEALVGTASRYTANVYHPLKKFAGNLTFGNGNTVAVIDSTGTVTSSIIGTGTNAGIYSALNPPLDTTEKVMDLETSISNDYLVIPSADILQEERLDSTGYDIVTTFGSQGGKLNLWNGTDPTITAATNIPSYLISEVHTYFKNNSFFAEDSFGTALNDGNSKTLSLPNNKPPSANAVAVNGNFLTWACAETNATARFVSLYYYGALDQENPKGLYRLLRWSTPQSSGFVSKVPLNLLVSNKYTTVNTAQTALVTYGFGKHYIGYNSVNSGGPQNFLLCFLVTPTGSGTPQTGVYETQNQLFSKRIGISQLRVYTEPTVSGNGFQLDIIGGDGNVIDNGTFTYSFGSFVDPNTNSNAVERINFNPGTKTLFTFGVRITNTGTTNMTIKKVEIDITEEGK